MPKSKLTTVCGDAADCVIDCFRQHGATIPDEHEELCALIDALSAAIAPIMAPTMRSSRPGRHT